MARFRRKASRRGGFRAFKSRRSGGSSGLTPMNIILAGAVYGAARPHAAKVLPDLFSFGPIDSDNAIIGAAGYMGMKQKGFLKALGTVALASEVGIVAAKMTTGSNTGGQNDAVESN